MFKDFIDSLLKKCALVITKCKHILRMTGCIITFNFKENDNWLQWRGNMKQMPLSSSYKNKVYMAKQSITKKLK